MKKSENSIIQVLLLIGALIIALGFRLIRLDTAPLTNSEADIALQALSIANGKDISVGAYPVIVGLSAFDFFIFAESNFLARLWPAILGSLIVVVPFLFRKQVGLWTAAAASLVLAISPELVGLSRLLATPMVAMTCLLLALGLFYQRKPILSGGFLALGLMSGSGFWLGILMLAVSFMISDWLFGVSTLFSSVPVQNKGKFWISLSVSFTAVILVVGTSFFMAPQGLSGIFTGLVEFFTGFFKPRIIPVSLILLAVIGYALGAVFFGIWGGIRAIIFKEKLDLFLFVWAGFALIFSVVYADSKPSNIIWFTLPLRFLAVRAFASALRRPEKSSLAAIGTGLLVVVVSAFMLLALRTLIRPGLTQEQQLNTFIALIGGLILITAVILLINFGWGEDIALTGLLSGLAVVIIAGMISASVNTTSLSTDTSYALWLPEDRKISNQWLLTSIERVHNWNELRNEPIEIAVADLDTSSMAWTLRDYDPVFFMPYIPPQSQPGILITANEAVPEISSAYRGQDLVWSREVLWREMSASQVLSWMITQDAPTKDSQIILWVRTDLMADDQISP